MTFRAQDIASCDAQKIPAMEVSLIERLEEIKELFRIMQNLGSEKNLDFECPLSLKMFIKGVFRNRGGWTP